MKLRDLTNILDAIAPPHYAEPWDNVGLLVGDYSADIVRGMLTIDCTETVYAEARSLGCQFVLAYHPTIFDGIKKLHASSVVFQAIRDGIAIYSPHTALDVAEGGTNDVLADIVGMITRAPLRPSKANDTLGLGRVGSIVSIERSLLIERIRKGLGVEKLLVAGPVDGMVDRVAVGAGACGDMIKEVLASKAGLYLTGEMRHHDALRSAERGVTVVCALHSNSERVTLAHLAQKLSREANGVEWMISQHDHDPFVVM
jgi:dinuclear metal center YbgI/SA1388 family protein